MHELLTCAHHFPFVMRWIIREGNLLHIATVTSFHSDIAIEIVHVPFSVTIMCHVL